MNLAERLQHAMDKGPNAPINANQLALRSGVTRSAISQVLSGKSKTLKSENATKIAGTLGVRVDWLVDGSAPMVEGGTARPETRKTPKDGIAPELAALLDKATPRSREELMRIAKAAAAGLLTEADTLLLRQIADRFAKT